MILEWKQSESMAQPLVVDNDSSPHGVYIRKNIVEHEFEGLSKWTYDEAFLDEEYKFDIEDPEQYLAKVLEVLKIETLKQNEIAYNQALNKPLLHGNIFLLAVWTNTYTNALSKARELEADGKVATSNVIILTPQGKFDNVLVSSSDDLKPMYDIVSDEWQRVTDLRNVKMVEIQNAPTLEALSEITIEY